ncbi:MAG: homocysteine S-methyltransferase family protein [Eggerthellaceae bacterium]|jgi:5-methyltetrahydrofolate--homocysteine methyltransferase|nr:homocysteine S-methyltransferase family protein [Eggerthellaceae bacterium]
MPDIEARFNKDMLVLSAPLDTRLAREGIDVEHDREFVHLVEPKMLRDMYGLELVAGAQCLVTNTAGITRARLSHVNMEERASELAQAALDIAHLLKPQHILAQIGSTELPLDATSAPSLRQNRDQYAQAALSFGEGAFDAFFLNSMTNALDMQCALMGIRKHSDKPIIASLCLNEEGKLLGSLSDVGDALAMMVEYGADVVGFEWSASLEKIVSLVEDVKEKVVVPLVVQLAIKPQNPSQQALRSQAPQQQTQDSRETNPYSFPDTMIEAAARLRGAGVQFLRASGDATPAYTAALVAASSGFDVIA